MHPSRRLLSRFVTTVAVAALAVAAALVGADGAQAAPHGRAPAPADAAATRLAASTPVAPDPTCADDATTLRYLVVFARGTTPGAARNQITVGCGTTTVYYPEIAVAVATSADPTFTDRLGRDRAYSAEAESTGGPARTVRSDARGWQHGPQAAERDQAAERVRASAQQAPETPVPSTDRRAEQWDMTMIRADQAHKVTEGSRDVLVGVLDGGIDATHPDLAAAVDPSTSAGCLTGGPDTNPAAWAPSGVHGTHVAGTIAAADDGKGITGVAPGVRLASVRVVDDDGFIYPEYAVCGFMWAAREHMRLTSNSYFVDPWLFTCATVPGQAVAHEAVLRAVTWANQRGVLSVAAMGNESTDLAHPAQDTKSPDNAPVPRTRPVDNTCDVMPTELPGVVGVSSVGAQRVLSSFSSYGLGVVTVTAPGGDFRQRSPASSSGCVLSTVPGGYGYLCGTSMATPHVTGVLALIASRHPTAGPAQLVSMLTDQAVPQACPAVFDPDDDGTPDATCTSTGQVTSFYGRGMADALNAARS